MIRKSAIIIFILFVSVGLIFSQTYQVKKAPTVKKSINVTRKKPDLKVSINFDTPYTWAGKSTKVTFTVVNNGTKASKATILLCDTNWQSWHVPILQRFKKFTKTITWIPKSNSNGKWGALVDRLDKMGDSNRKNNTVYEKIEVRASDLIVCVEHNDIAPVGKLVKIITTVKNTGDGPSMNKCKLLITVGRRKSKYYTVPTLLPGKTFTITRKNLWTLPGKIWISARVDTKDSVEESTESNNTAKSSLDISPIPAHDLLGDTSYKKICSDGSK